MSGEAFGLGKPEVKAQLARLGYDLDPDLDVYHYERPVPGEMTQVVLLDRVRPGTGPDYEVLGYASCAACDELCWLGSRTHQLVASGSARPLCLDCSEGMQGGTKLGHASDEP
jgi:hypothetical protein